MLSTSLGQVLSVGWGHCGQWEVKGLTGKNTKKNTCDCCTSLVSPRQSTNLQNTALRRGAPSAFSLPVPFDSDVFHLKCCMAWGLARRGRDWGPSRKGGWERRKIKKSKAAGTHLLGMGQEGGPGPGKSARLL